mgnify:CR=1 FL=1|tara:strand:+ start:246 stop:425 length:180 start_codon:yes stop_codon:yes gene_type:complete
MERGTKIGRIFKGMGSSCPGELAAYGQCVIKNAEAIEKDVCSKEFEKLKKCFRKIRAKK